MRGTRALSFLMSSATYNLQRVRYRHTHVPDGELPRDNGLGREDTPEAREIYQPSSGF